MNVKKKTAIEIKRIRIYKLLGKLIQVIQDTVINKKLSNNINPTDRKVC